MGDFMNAIEAKTKIFRFSSVYLFVCTFVHANHRNGSTKINAVFTDELRLDLCVFMFHFRTLFMNR